MRRDGHGQPPRARPNDVRNNLGGRMLQQPQPGLGLQEHAFDARVLAGHGADRAASHR